MKDKAPGHEETSGQHDSRKSCPSLTTSHSAQMIVPVMPRHNSQHTVCTAVTPQCHAQQYRTRHLKSPGRDSVPAKFEEPE